MLLTTDFYSNVKRDNARNDFIKKLLRDVDSDIWKWISLKQIDYEQLRFDCQIELSSERCLTKGSKWKIIVPRNLIV